MGLNRCLFFQSLFRLLLGLALLVSCMGLSYCSYRLGHGGSQLPGGYKSVFVHIFNNSSQETGAEYLFTQALIKEMQRAPFVELKEDPKKAQVSLHGSIVAVTIRGQASINTFYEMDYKKQEAYAFDASMFTEYILSVSVNVNLRRRTDDQVLWQTNLSKQRQYRGALLKKDGLRSSNPLYNKSAKRQTIEHLAKDMMSEVFSRLTENF